MRKILAVILIIFAAFSIAACNSYSVEGEKDAIKSYKCSSKNMLGLEKIVIFEDHVVAVFDRKAPKTGYEIDVDKILRSQELHASATLSGVNNYQCTSKYEINAERFVVTFYLSSFDGDNKLISPVQGRDITRIDLEDYCITINSGNLRVNYSTETADSVQNHYQDYIQVSKKWSKINQKTTADNTLPAA